MLVLVENQTERHAFVCVVSLAWHCRLFHPTIPLEPCSPLEHAEGSPPPVCPLEIRRGQEAGQAYRANSSREGVSTQELVVACRGSHDHSGVHPVQQPLPERELLGMLALFREHQQVGGHERKKNKVSCLHTQEGLKWKF
eukprot:scaffold259220_cov20-Tisochrysis_lutea.AAC.1